jgi:hypothetical protein
MSKAGGGTEAKSAMSELITELDRTRKEFAKSAMHVTQLETQLQTTRDDLVRKDQRILTLESDLTATEERHRQLVNTMEESYKSKELAWLHRVKTLELEVKRLQADNEAMLLLERENRQLRDTILENQSVMERLQSINDDLRNKSKEENKDQSAFLEAEFRKRLADSEKKFRAEAYRALSEEAKLALQGNDHLQTVLQRQNDSIEAVLLRCKTLEQSHSKIQEEQEENLTSINAHVSEIQRLKKQLLEARSKGNMMDEALKQRRVERASLELLFVEYETTRKQLAQVRERCRRAQRESERWKNRAVQLTHELDDEQRESAEAKLSAMQQQSDNIETHLEKKKQRDSRRARVLASNADGATALRQAEDAAAAMWSDGGESDAAAWDAMSDEEEQHAGRSLHHRTVDPMEILAMWNVNFDSWRPSQDEDPSKVASVERQVGRPQQVETISDVPEIRPASVPHTNLTSNAVPSSSDLPPVGASPVGGQSQMIAFPPQAGSTNMRVADRRAFLDSKLSVLSQPKSTAVPPGARHYAKNIPKRPLDLQRQPMPPMQELNTVSKGEFKIAKRGGSGGDGRFLVP